ncbi:Ricin-type beta-trefoil lectin domain-containing protein [Thermomonospora echinospora]|uniref:Ricin-type beta-trefoil lectin domain-containing protein n=1 Tax=Thermomonospora echinospora TaxID=1992 RepID=A0A1H6E1G3_9ACTN|nr:RICIN domain-containing protein [Thermomonospora echinospora]SEG91402.1 Ricin-type beta-trefoil lectin domain-containing protein [Thermomonospora echinospora]
MAGRTSETDKLSATPQGTLLLETSPVPVRAKRGDTFQDVDLTLERRADGSIGPKVSAASVSFGGGGDRTLATMAADGKALTLTWPGQTLPEPVLNGPNATYPDAAGPGIDLMVTATATGMTHYVVVKTPQAAENPDLERIEFGVQAPGLQLREQPDGAVSAVDASGEEVFTAPEPQMWEGVTPAEHARPDSPDPDAVSAGPAPGANVKPMAVEVGSGQVAVVPDRELLESADTKYPLVIDPGWQTWNTGREADDDGYGSRDSGWAYVDRTHEDQSYWKPTRLPTGRETEDYTDKRSFIRMNVDRLHRGANGRKVKINSVAITFDTQHAWSCTARDVRLFNMEHFSSTTTWNTRPDGYIPAGSGWDTSWLATKSVGDKGRPECGDDGEANDVRFTGGNLARLVQWATDNGWDIFTLGIYPDADHNDAHTWKVFDPDPRMTVEFSHYPDPPSEVHMTNGGTKRYSCVQGAERPWLGVSHDRQLRADLRDLDGDNSGLYTGQLLRGRFEVYQEVTDGNNAVIDSWYRYSPEDGTPADGPFEKASADSGKLHASVTLARQDPSNTPNGGTFYRWRVQAEDETYLDGDWSPWCEFMVDGKRPKSPSVSSPDYPKELWSGYDSVARRYKSTNFTFGSGGSGDVVKYGYKFSDGTKGEKAVSLGQSSSVPWTPKKFGWQWVEVTSYDRAGNPSPTVKYEFGVEQPPRDAGWSMDDAGGGVARAVGQTGVDRPAANIVFSGGPTQGEPGNRGAAMPADKAVRFNGTDQYGAVNPVLDTGTGGQAVPLVDTANRFMFSAWVRLDTTSGDRVAVSQTAADGSVFELGWLGARWTFRHRASNGTVIAQAVQSQATPSNGSSWTDNWVSLMAGYDPIADEIWLRTEAPYAKSPDCVRDYGEELCDPEPVLRPQTVTVSHTWTPAAGQGALLIGATTAVGGGKGSYWSGWLDDMQLWPLSHPDDTVLSVIYNETVQDQLFAGMTLRLVNVNSGHCLDVTGGGTASGVNVRQLNCNAGAAQNWQFTDVGDGYYTLTNSNSGKCLDIDGTDGSGTADGRNAWQYDCNGSEGQQWKPEKKDGGYWLKSRRSNKCLVVDGSSTTSGSNVSQWSCQDGVRGQVWNITEEKRHELNNITYRLHGFGSGKCLEVAGASSDPGANVRQGNCSGATSQDWTFRHQGDSYYSLTNVNSGECLEVAGASPNAGANVVQGNCLPGEPRQSWKVVAVGDDGNQGYRLTAKHSGLVLEVSDASTADGANVVQNTPEEPVQPHQVWKLGCLPSSLWRCTG